jgi:hypothetical protein
MSTATDRRPESDHCTKSLSGTHLWVTSDGQEASGYYSSTPAVQDLYCLMCGAHRQVVNRQIDVERKGQE